MADVFAFYDCSEGAPPGQAAMVTIWARGWANRGWNPRLITARHARRSKFYAKHKEVVELIPLLALHAVGGGWLTPLRVMNFNFPVRKMRRGLIASDEKIFQGTQASIERFFRRGVSDGYAIWASVGGTPDRPSLMYFENPSDALSCGRVL